ncbi:drug/metabolite transporter (DMT)-like permease [Psychromicrobium silvestre]|uniref:Drug/metabolite transporter (DMT)-like permease n=1 Tax=Psychromicrobium silvestre TaxID=1645614 RepID=A0A7Y9S6B5_9MICC|nr:hypothetical protein [Psychromicrobium silvestre]NYE95313.1 drug/metabolite transporter (DMT)-like permease [Psychromicrobium silvestre]
MSNQETPNAPERAGVRISTLVWGVLLIAIGALIVVGRYSSLDLDPRLAMIGILLLAGVALVFGGVLSAISRSRTSRQTEQADPEPLELG